MTVLGFGSSLVGGIISDKYEKKSYMIKSYIIMAGNLLALPMISMACLTGNFWIAMTGFALKVMVSGSYLAPAITMMQNSAGAGNAGMVVSVYTFYSNIVQTIAPALFGVLAKYYGAFDMPSVYGKLITAFVISGYSISSYFYYKAGKEYQKKMTERDNQMAANLAVA